MTLEVLRHVAPRAEIGVLEILEDLGARRLRDFEVGVGIFHRDRDRLVDPGE